MNHKEYFNGKKITVMGLGLLGRGVGDVKFLAEQGADLIVTDLKTKEQLQSSLDQLSDFPNIKFTLGEHRLEDFRDRDFILKGAGVPLDNIYIKEAEKNNIPVEMSTALFCSLLPEDVTVIGITGTRGKSTVTQFIYEGLNGNVSGNVFLGGNIRGVSTLAMLPEVKTGDFIVLELDSWQLQGFGTKGISPNIAVFTTIFADHMNYYKDSMDMYIKDKANIFLNQKEGDVFILGKQAESEIESRYSDYTKKAIVIDVLDDVTKLNLKLPGRHNQYNASLAFTALRSVGIETDNIKKSFENMEPVEGRLQFVRDFDGIKIYNDNNATTPDATMAALNALKDNGDIVLIIGGADKGLPLDKMIEKISETTRKVILLPGSGTDRLIDRGLREKGVSYFHAFNLPDAVKEAGKVIKRGDVLLFSPAFASFGEFNNEYERNDIFLKEVGKLK